MLKILFSVILLVSCCSHSLQAIWSSYEINTVDENGLESQKTKLKIIVLKKE